MIDQLSVALFLFTVTELDVKKPSQAQTSKLGPGPAKDRVIGSRVLSILLLLRVHCS